jgi:CDP-diglyceride synthetase
MSPIAIAFVVLACVFGGALFGMFLGMVLPEHHLSEPSKDVVKLVTGLIATLAALVLGLLVASSKSSFDTANEGFRQSAAKVILLDRTLAQYGPETKDVREMLRKGFAARIDQLLPKDHSQHASLGAAQGTAAVEGFAQKLRALSPQTDVQRALQSRALEIIDSVAQARWMEIEEQENAIPTPFLVVLILWLAVMFASFGLFAPRNAIAVTALFLGALSLSGAIFLIEELNNPLGGFISISRAPMDRALGFIGN